MLLDYTTLEALRGHHPAWRLLCSDHATLVASFLHRIYIAPNRRVMSSVDLTEALEDELFGLRERLGQQAFPKSALDYLNEWASPEKNWLRKFYQQNSDEPQFDLTPATEKAIQWLSTLNERSFVGTESRLLTLFELLKQINMGSETDPTKRIAELQQRRDEIDAELARVIAGDIDLLDDTAVRDRFQQLTQTARELLTDLREVEYNFRQLDRHVRQKIALWEGSKGELLEEIMGERDAITDSDQGRSFRAFWDFLMSSRRQEELSTLLEKMLALPSIAALRPDPRIARIHYDWLEAGEYTQRTVAQLSQQLRRFLDDKAWLEDRRIMEILHSIEARAVMLRDAESAMDYPTEMMTIRGITANIELPMERPLYTPSLKTLIENIQLEAGDEDLDASILYTQIHVDLSRITQHIQKNLQECGQVTLSELTQWQPLQQGLAELVAYLQLGCESFKTVVNEDIIEVISWSGNTQLGLTITKRARLPQVIFVRSS